MRLKQLLVWSAALGATAGSLAFLMRPARLLSAKVTAVTPGTPAIAHVALSYGGGVLPTSVIVDVIGAEGRGSATIAGEQLFVDVVVAGSASGVLRVLTTAAYRLLGRRIVRQHEFTEPK